MPKKGMPNTLRERAKQIGQSIGITQIMQEKIINQYGKQKQKVEQRNRYNKSD